MSDRSMIARDRAGPLARVALPVAEGLSVSLAPDAARFILRGTPALSSVFGPAVPERLRASRLDTRSTLWLGPDEMLLLAPGEDAAEIQPGLEQALTGAPHSLVDISQRQIGLVIAGRLAELCLSAGCPLDLRLAGFPVGMVTRTIYLKTEIVLWRQAETRFHVEVWRSFAPYLVGHLAEALTGTNGL